MDETQELLEALGRIKKERSTAYSALVDYALMDRRSLRTLSDRYRQMESGAPTRRLSYTTKMVQ